MKGIPEQQTQQVTNKLCLRAKDRRPSDIVDLTF